VEVGDGDAATYVDLGAVWVGRLHTEVRALADRLGLVLSPGYFEYAGHDASQTCSDVSSSASSGEGGESGANDTEASNIGSRQYEQFRPFPSFAGDAATRRAMQKLDALASEVDLDKPWAATNAYLGTVL
jgi:hypothetical protein